MDGAEAEMEKTSKFLNILELQKKKNDQVHDQTQHYDQIQVNVRVRASDMPLRLQNPAFKTAREIIDDSKSSKSTKVDSKRLALALKKDFDTTYGRTGLALHHRNQLWLVRHTFSRRIDKINVLLFRTAVWPMDKRNASSFSTLKILCFPLFWLAMFLLASIATSVA